MREHDLSVKNKTKAHLPAHCLACTSGECVPLGKEVKCTDTKEGEILEAYNIRKKGGECVSNPSVFLHKQELVHVSADM